MIRRTGLETALFFYLHPGTMDVNLPVAASVSVDVQGITGKKKSFTTLPFSRIQYFTIQTPGFMEPIPDSELFICFSDGTRVTFEIKGDVDMDKIGRAILYYVLAK